MPLKKQQMQFGNICILFIFLEDILISPEAHTKYNQSKFFKLFTFQFIMTSYLVMPYFKIILSWF